MTDTHQPMGERIASLEANTHNAAEELRRIREQNHTRIREDNEFRTVVLTRLGLIEQGQKDVIDSIREYQDECSRDRVHLDGRLEDAEGKIANLDNLRSFIVGTTLVVGPVIGFIVNTAIAWAKR